METKRQCPKHIERNGRKYTCVLHTEPKRYSMGILYPAHLYPVYNSYGMKESYRGFEITYRCGIDMVNGDFPEIEYMVYLTHKEFETRDDARKAIDQLYDRFYSYMENMKPVNKLDESNVYKGRVRRGKDPLAGLSGDEFDQTSMIDDYLLSRCDAPNKVARITLPSLYVILKERGLTSDVIMSNLVQYFRTYHSIFKDMLKESK